ncbi:MAG: 23S rRNA (adenine(2503)-C(2))-methyltransferase RlmN [Bdellovibrionales bacterium]
MRIRGHFKTKRFATDGKKTERAPFLGIHVEQLRIWLKVRQQGEILGDPCQTAFRRLVLRPVNQGNFYDLNFYQLADLFAEQGLEIHGPRYLFNWHYKKNRREPCEIFGLSQKAQKFLQSLNFDLPEITEVLQSADRTVKFRVQLHDGLVVETVLLPFQGKYTVCLSSQVGCAMACSFCRTGEQGLKRNLNTSEIVGQLLRAREWLRTHRPGDERILNVVFMGQGEPLHNFDSVRTAVEIMVDNHGLSLATHKITISTAGYLPGLKRWQNEMPEVNLALSLHSTRDELRSQLIPLNRRYSLKDILPWIDAIPLGKKRFVTFEYLLLAGVNDTDEDARQLGELLQNRRALLNLIPFNAYSGSPYSRPSKEQTDRFKIAVDEFKIPTMIRGTKGDQILAACGQLTSKDCSQA